MAKGKQDERSQQSLDNTSGAEPGQSSGSGTVNHQQVKPGTGSSQEQDRAGGRHGESSGRRPPGTADIERSSARPLGEQDSLVNDPTGAYKERP